MKRGSTLESKIIWHLKPLFLFKFYSLSNVNFDFKNQVMTIYKNLFDHVPILISTSSLVIYLILEYDKILLN